eukprot:TRINITY_DN34268_c0_g1_i2.p1 TRINITY_DN34268_c0_g1~~TRINITY_DN34268_c0_g1_i2.p1  ORF type:complete len:110 (-),score=11.06 TRINITY_DN34268_c0_g1_i2:263-592(-)
MGRISGLGSLPFSSAKQCKARWYECLDPSIKKVSDDLHPSKLNLQFGLHLDVPQIAIHLNMISLLWIALILELNIWWGSVFISSTSMLTIGSISVFGLEKCNCLRLLFW